MNYIDTLAPLQFTSFYMELSGSYITENNFTNGNEEGSYKAVKLYKNHSVSF